MTYSSDRYGNLTCVTNASTNGPCGNWTFNTANNRISNAGFSFDAAGNLTADGTGTGTHTFQWDAEGRMKSVDGGATVSYVYNALGQRVEKKVGSVYTEYVYGAYGEVVATHDRSTWTRHYAPPLGGPLAVYQDGTTRFFHANALGSTTFLTDHTGTVTQKSLFYPWGQRWTDPMPPAAGRNAELPLSSGSLREEQASSDGVIIFRYAGPLPSAVRGPFLGWVQSVIPSSEEYGPGRT